MNQYHKIKNVFKRDPGTKRLIEGDWATEEIGYLKSCMWTCTEKVDGTNIRVKIEGDQISFAGKTDAAEIPGPLMDALDGIFRTEAMEDAIGEVFTSDVCLYGEGYGPKIQKVGALYRPDPSFVLFDIKIGPWWLTRAAVENIGRNLGLDVVPIVFTGPLDEAVEYVKGGFDSEWGDFQAEGLVCKPTVDVITRGGERIICKIKHKEFN